ncbi:MAG: exodeoxyribonuclease III [Candidatus Dactylopiibacterium carminicum]|nr:MAG: exodeoxyribonuclease III [Candidatus Dactylopiibacterium carminicum]
MLRVITANLNGVRSAATKGFYDWLAQQSADVVCLQELKAQAADMSEIMLAPSGYTGHFHYAEKKGYSGVAVYARQQPTRVLVGIDVVEFDAEGRYLQADFDTARGALSVVSLYLPSGSSSEERQQAKFRFMDVFAPRMESLRGSGREVIICADWNIAHREIDLRNWKSNQKNSGFLPEERAWLGARLETGWVDVYRRLHPEATDECYTWWSNRGQAWAKNVGWRLDYQLATPGIAALAKQASIYKAQRFSDHAPLTIDYDW